MNYMLILNYFFDKVTSSKLYKKKQQTKKTPKTQQKQHPIHVDLVNLMMIRQKPGH